MFIYIYICVCVFSISTYVRVAVLRGFLVFVFFFGVPRAETLKKMKVFEFFGRLPGRLAKCRFLGSQV